MCRTKNDCCYTEYDKGYEPRPGWTMFILAISIVFIIPGYYYVYQPATIQLANLDTTTEILFLPPLNQTVLCGNTPCKLITYDYGIYIGNQTLISNTTSTYCAINDDICAVDFFKSLQGSCQQIWYDIRNPAGTITHSGSLHSQALTAYGGGIAMFAIGGVFGIISLILVFTSLRYYYVKYWDKIEETKKTRQREKEKNERQLEEKRLASYKININND